jgi:hypothetical protein
LSGAVLIAFVLAIYLPHAAFRLWTERYVDLGRRRDASYFDELVAPILPSALLHFQTWLIIHGVCVVRNLLRPAPQWHFPGADWGLILTLYSDTSVASIAAITSDWYLLMWPVAYVVVLSAVVFVNGLVFGSGLLIGIYVAADPVVFPGVREQAQAEGWWNKVKLYVRGVVVSFWKLFYYENLVLLAPWGLLKPFVFVKTKDGSLFHGRFETYEKTREGQVDAIILRQATRFSRRPIREALADGEHPLRSLQGSLYLKWSEIADINTTEPGEIQRLWKRYETRRRHMISLRPPDAPPLPPRV